MKRMLAAVLVAGIGILAGCSPDEFKRDNPLDPESPDFVEPVVTSVSISDNQVFDSRKVTVTWKGKRYRVGVQVYH